MNFFKLYIGDYQRDTAHLSIAENGAYLLMLQHYYATEKPLPIAKALHRMLRAQDKTERDAIDAVAAQFWTTTDAGLVNERADQEITKADAQAETNRAIARQREARRKAAREQHESSTNRATNDQPNHSQTPDTNREAKASRRGSRLPSEWEPGEEGIAFASKLGLAGDRATSEAGKFRDYWTAKPGKDGVKTDWQATWRNWLRNASERTSHQAESFRERDQRQARERVSAFTGGLASASEPSPSKAVAEIIDMEVGNAPRRLG